MTKYASINPSSIPAGVNDSGLSNEFAALVNVKSSRYVKYEYAPETGLAPKIGIKWVMGTTKGNTFDRMWSTGVLWEGNEAAISADGKQCSVNIKRNSDGFYLLEKALESGFPSDRLTDDISVFEGETFFMATDGNPRAKGSKRKVYPKRYHPEGWDVALESALQKRAAKAAQQNAPAYTPSAVVKTDTTTQVFKAATEALNAIVKNSGIVNRSELPKHLSAYVEQNNIAWDDNFRREVAIALWDMSQLTVVVATNPNLTINGETISTK